MKKSPRYYINPFTNRTIKNTTNTYNELIISNYLPKKDKCLYNKSAAEKCLKRIFKRYPHLSNKISLPSSFQKIPSTHISRIKYYRGYIKDGESIIGVVDKYGNVYKTRRAILTSKEIPIVKDPLSKIQEQLDESEALDLETQLEIEKDIENYDKVELNLLYNPIQHDFIPIKKDIKDKALQLEIINSINEVLITDEKGTIIGRIK